MKKLINIAFLAFATLLFSCSGDELLVESQNETQQMLSAISFDQEFVDKSTRSTTRAGIALSDYASTMGVWGWRDPVSDNELMFNNQKVEYDNTESKWTYSPLKYWNTNDIYDFYAYSPYDNTNVTINTDNSRAYLIYINNIALTGVNLQETPAAKEKMLFQGTADTDWLVARTPEIGVKGANRNTVQFTMQHILSKLNIRIKVSDLMASVTGIDKITLDKLTIGKFSCNADFKQKLSRTPTTDAEKLTNEWSNVSGDLTLQRSSECEISNSFKYVLESLVLPQAVDADDEVSLEYTIHYTDHTERFKYSMKVADISADMQHLYSGYNYTISFLIDPDCITFTANAANWDDNQTGNAGLY